MFRHLLASSIVADFCCKPKKKRILRSAASKVSSVERPFAFSSLLILVAAAPKPIAVAKMGSAVLQDSCQSLALMDLTISI